jgi:hypothetical protein
MIVYRIEYEDRLGPYGTVWHPTTLREKLANILLNKHSNLRKWPPAIYLQPKLMILGHDYRCGCTSIKKLRKWFYGYQSSLHKAGAKIAIYEVDEITEDGRQCVFEFDKAKLIKKVRITASNKRMCV